MHTRDRDRLLVLGERVRRAQGVIERSIAEVMRILADVPTIHGVGPIDNLFGRAADARTLFNRPIVDTVAMTVTWRGARCPLGYTRLLDLIERLVRNPNRWIPYERLLREVWGDDLLEEDTIKVAVTRLRAKLREHGMAELARMIHVCGYRCGYFPDGLPE